MWKCGACQDGPRGIEGHDELFARTMDGRRMQFVCRSCGAVWARHYNGSGSFDWEALGAQLQGAAVPGGMDHRIECTPELRAKGGRKL